MKKIYIFTLLISTVGCTAYRGPVESISVERTNRNGKIDTIQVAVNPDSARLNDKLILFLMGRKRTLEAAEHKLANDQIRKSNR
jgi:hypothetical protein